MSFRLSLNEILFMLKFSSIILFFLLFLSFVFCFDCRLNSLWFTLYTYCQYVSAILTISYCLVIAYFFSRHSFVLIPSACVQVCSRFIRLIWCSFCSHSLSLPLSTLFATSWFLFQFVIWVPYRDLVMWITIFLKTSSNHVRITRATTTSNVQSITNVCTSFVFSIYFCVLFGVFLLKKILFTNLSDYDCSVHKKKI